MKNKILVSILSVLLLLAVILFMTYSYISKNNLVTPDLLKSTENVQKEEITLLTDIPNKKLRFSDEEGLRKYLDTVNFWDKEKLVVSSGKSVKPVSLMIMITASNSGHFDRQIDPATNTVLSSFDYASDEDGELKVTVFLNNDVINASNYNSLINSTLVRAIFIINKNSAITPDDLSTLNNLNKIYFIDPNPIFIELKDKSGANKFSLVKKVLAADSCHGGQVVCGYTQTWSTCGGDRYAMACPNGNSDCVGFTGASATCVNGSECVVEDAGYCEGTLYPFTCGAGYVCNPLGCVASGSCWWGSAASTPTPTGGNGCITTPYGVCRVGNCADDETGHGLGASGCPANAYYCTGTTQSGECNPPPPPPSCTLTLAPASIPIGNNSTTTFIASVTPANGTVTNVTFVSSNTAVATVNPASDASVSYSTVATAVSVGSSTITASAVMSGSVRCTDTSVLNVINADPWWQVKDGDVTTNGDLRSGTTVPAGNYFGLAGAGGYPGVPVYGGSTNLTTSNVSVKGWLANSSYSSSKLFNSNYFLNAVPDEALPNIISIPSDSVAGSFFESGGTPFFGYYGYLYDGRTTGIPLKITSAANLGSRKVILFVRGADLQLNSNINLNDGLGFFLAITTGNIIVAPTVGGGATANLEGVYVADGSFSTGTTGTNSDTKLWVRGTVAAFGGMSLQRDLADNSGPAELFEFAPDQELLFPTKFSYYPSAWREVAP